jgi:hypothetical protein
MAWIEDLASIYVNLSRQYMSQGYTTPSK